VRSPAPETPASTTPSRSKSFRPRRLRSRPFGKLRVVPSTVEGRPSRAFEREAWSISQLNHRHICALHDVGVVTLPDFVGAGFSRPDVPFLVAEE